MTTNQKLAALKRQLSEEVQKDISDNNVILALSSEIAKLDQENIRFSVDAGIINRLGRELVARQETAVSELVKNSYDADATEVKLIFENAWDEGGTLYVDDNGLGMNRDQLINGFMRLSSADKINNPFSDKYQRTRAGKKGIGRFATQRLGDKLVIITQTSLSKHALRVAINWEDFASDRDLLSVSNSIEEIPKTKNEGTTLVIEGLREGWSDAMIKRVFRYTGDLLQPFPLSHERQQEHEARVDPGFKSTYFRRDDGHETAIVDEQLAFYTHALAEIKGHIDNSGQGHWHLKSEKLDFDESFLIGKNSENPSSPYDIIRDVHFQAYYFIYDASLLPPQTMTFIKEVANEKGGIRIYRNGFRVLPYGEKLNDWLGLDESTAKRVILGSHRNINFFGFVEISDRTGVMFDETSSREGLFENLAFKELVDFVQRSIISAVLKVAELRGRKGSTGQHDWRLERENTAEQVDNAIEELGILLDKPENAGVSGQYRDAVEKLKSNRQLERMIIDEERNHLILEINMLRVLAGLGLVIGEFVHEVKRFLPAFDSDIIYLKSAVKDYSDALRRAQRLDDNLRGFTAYTAYFDKAISQNVLRDVKPLNLVDIINDFEEVISSDIERSAIVFERPQFRDFNLITLPMHPSEWASILFNLYTNSKKAIRRAGAPGKIQIDCGRQGGQLYIDFSDNGDGVPDGNEEIIFNAFYTTSSAVGNSASDSDTLTGTGLGLKIVKDIVESYNGEVFVKPPVEGYKTTFRLLIPTNG